MVVLVAPLSFSQACNALSVIWLGKPDEAPSTMMAIIFGLDSTSRNDGLSSGASAAAWPVVCDLSFDACIVPAV